MDKELMKPVAWRKKNGSGWLLFYDADNANAAGDAADPLYPAPPVPRDVLMAAMNDLLRAQIKIGNEGWIGKNLFGDIEGIIPKVSVEAIADRYASKVQPERFMWGMNKKTILALAAELVRGAECMSDDETELTLEVRLAGTVQDDDGSMNAGPVLAIFDAEYPEEGCYPIDPENPTAGRAPEPATQPEPVNQQMLAALKAVMKGSEYKTIMGVTGWHQISMPKESALDLARAAIAAAEAAQPVAVEQMKSAANNWPSQCPITRREFFMEIDGVPTYGGPFDSYTIPEMTGEANQPFHERELFVRRYDHDRGGWVEDEFIPLRVIHEDVLMELEEAAKPASPQPVAVPDAEILAHFHGGKDKDAMKYSNPCDVVYQFTQSELLCSARAALSAAQKQEGV